MNRYANAYFSYNLIRIKGSGSCSRAGESGDFLLIPNMTGGDRISRSKRRAGGLRRDIMGAIRKPNEISPDDETGIGGIRFLG